MNKKYAIATAVFVILLLVAFAVFRGRASRELILKRSGLPLANLTADVRASTKISSATDADGRLDLSDVPSGTRTILLTLSDGASVVYEGLIRIPARGSWMIDFRGDRTVCTTQKTYADFGLFKVTGQTVMESIEFASSSKVDAEQVHSPEPAAGSDAVGKPSPPAE